MAWDPPSDADLAPGKPGKPTLARRIRDLTPALAERASGTPWLNGAGAEKVILGFSGFEPFDLKGTWTVPEGVYKIHVFAVGGGGAGGNSVGAIVAAGGGGAGGCCQRVIDVAPGQVIPITIGAGGDPDDIHQSVDQSLDEFQIGDGARTTFGTPPFHLIALGGKRGNPVDDVSQGSAGGAGGAGDDFIVTVNGTNLFVRRWAGASGGSAVSTLAGYSWSGYGADSFFGGGGRRRHTTSDEPSFGDGHFASNPGAGGSGALEPTTGRGGRGRRGAVIIRY